MQVLPPNIALHLIVGHAAETPFKRKRDQRRQALGRERHAEDDDQHDRGDGGERPGDDAAGLPPAAAFDLERAGAHADFHLRRRVGHLEPRQRQGGYAFEAQHARPAIDSAQVGVGPCGDRDPVFDELES